MSAGRGTQSLLALCGGYFCCYVGTGLAVKYFTQISAHHHLSQLAYLIQNTAGSSFLVFTVILGLGWVKGVRKIAMSRRSWPVWVSGACTAVVIPSTTLLYLLPISILVAMVIMRGSVIVISRGVDAVLIWQGHLKKRISWEEEAAVGCALLAVATHLFGLKPGSFAFLRDRAAVVILGSYLIAYAIRIYIMNRYKNGVGSLEIDNRTYFSIEQMGSMLGMLVVIGTLVAIAGISGVVTGPLAEIRYEVLHPRLVPMLSGLPFAGVAFFSVFIFLFRGRTATFAGVLNRVTSLTAGTVSTLILAWAFGLPRPSASDWGSLAWIAMATALLAFVELKRK